MLISLFVLAATKVTINKPRHTQNMAHFLVEQMLQIYVAYNKFSNLPPGFQS